MCGLAGVAGRQLMKRDIECFKDILYVSALRGPHSTGVSSISPDKVVTQKLVDSAENFLIYYGGEGGYLHRKGQTVLMGHCRYATMGAVNHKNAHPFDVGRYVGAHNGTLADDRYQSKFRNGLTDSEMMFRSMAKTGVQEELESLDYFSAYAVSVYEKERQKLYLGRNTERDLFFGVDAERDIIFWASELSMLKFGALRHGLTLEYYVVTADKLLVFDIPTMTRGSMYSVIDLAVPEIPERYRSMMTWDKATQTWIEPEDKGNIVDINTKLANRRGQDPLPF